MVLNHKAAIEFLVDVVDENGFDRRTILNLHALLSDNLLGNPSASGRLRAIPVGIGKSVYEPLAVPQLIDEIFQISFLRCGAKGTFTHSCYSPIGSTRHLMYRCKGVPASRSRWVFLDSLFALAPYFFPWCTNPNP